MSASPARTFIDRLEGPLAAQLRTARELAGDHRPEPPPWAAAVPALAAALPAGVPRGALTELVGRRSSGRMAAVLGLLAAATGGGECAALVDLGDALDPQQAAAVGVDLERLLWARPRDLRETLAAAEAVVAGGFPLVVVDLGLPPVAGAVRGGDTPWLRLARAAREAGTTLVVSTPARRCGVAAAARIDLPPLRARWRGTPPGPLLLTPLFRSDPRVARGRDSGV